MKNTQANSKKRIADALSSEMWVEGVGLSGEPDAPKVLLRVKPGHEAEARRWIVEHGFDSEVEMRSAGVVRARPVKSSAVAASENGDLEELRALAQKRRTPR